MYYLQIQGGSKLSGEVKISGAKNAALPLIALTILSKNEVNIKNLPDVSDISFNFDFDSNAPKMSRRQMKKAIKKQMKVLEKQMTKYMIEMQKHIEKMGQEIEKRS